MKKIYFLVALVLSSFFLMQCSKDDNPAPAANNSSITINADKATAFIDEDFTFVVKKGDGTDVTSSSVISVNDTDISSNTFSSSTNGIFRVKAKFEGQISQELVIKVTTPPSSITLNASTTNTVTGEAVSFTVTGSDSNIYTNTSKYYIQGVEQVSSSFIPSAVGTYDVYAKLTLSNGVVLTSPTVQITVGPAINFNKRVVIEDFTGTWCGYCPRVSYAISQVETQTSDVSVVAIHRGNDPYNFSAASALEGQIGLTGYPTAMLNRNITWEYPENANVSQAVNLTTGTNPRVGVAFENATVGNTVNVKVKLKFGKTFSNLKLVVYAVEDNLIYNQTNYTSYYGGGSTIANFEHDNVVRAVLSSSILGESISGSFVTGDTYEKDFTYTIPATVNANNVKFVAMVVNTSNSALNSRVAGKNETQAFEVE